jgi:hypothetical protein
MRRSVHRHIDARYTAHAEQNLLPSRLMHGAITEEPGVRTEEGSILLEHRAKMSRPGFLFALEEELEVTDGVTPAAFNGRAPRASPQLCLVVARRAP